MHQTSTLAFLVPLVHPEASNSWEVVCKRLVETVTSLLARHPTGMVHIYLSVNKGATLPLMPKGVTTIPLDIPAPNTQIFSSQGNQETVRLDATRQDKGMKRLAGLEEAKKARFKYVMNVDADDLVSERLPSWISRNPGNAGWSITKGWLHRVGSNLIHQQDHFNRVCGSSHIYRTAIAHELCTTGAGAQSKVRDLLGSHMQAERIFSEIGEPLGVTPFRACIYRVGHINNISRRKRAVELWALRRNPMKLVPVLRKTRWVTRRLAQEFHIRGGEG